MDDRRYSKYDSRDSRPSPKIYISNLNIDTTENDLRKSFADFGTIVDTTLKQKATGIVFAFIEYESAEAAQKAVQGMNQQDFLGKELKVEFARGGDRNDRDRGGFRERGGSRGGRDRDDDRRRGGDRGDRGGDDRPKGCFNCNEIGHFARDCPKPRQPREFNRGGRSSGGDRDRGDRRDFRRDGGGDRRDKYRRKDSESKSKSRSRSHEKKRKYRKRSSSGSSHS